MKAPASRLLLTLVVLVATAVVGGHATSQGGARTVYFNVVDGKGAPVLDLTAADFALKEDGKTREIAKAELASGPLQIALMVDDGGFGLGGIREGLATFVNRLQGRSEIAIITTAGRNIVHTDFTASLPTLMGAINKLLPRNQSGAFLLDGLIEVSRALGRREAQRPVIVVVTSPAEEFSNVKSDDVLDAVQKSRAMVYVIELGAPKVTGMHSLDAKADDSTVDASARRNAVLGKAPQQSGGRAEQVVAVSGLPNIFAQLATELAGQYAVTYASTGTPSAKISIETTRKGVKVRAPQRVN